MKLEGSRTCTTLPGWCYRILLAVLLSLPLTARADDIADALRKLDPVVLPAKEDKDHYRKLLPAIIDAQLKEANIKSTREWNAITNLTQWEAFRKEKLAALCKGIGEFPANRCEMNPKVTRTLTGEGFTIECLAFESRPGFLVTANLYVPDPLPGRAPAIIIHPSHHNPKTQGELQDMGMTWARAGCYVLVMDQIGHGERRAHPFASDADYPKPFRAGRQDYWFRYNTGMQLHLIGDSLIGWQAYDLSRGVDYVLTRKNVDAKRIAMMGSVAGGGDPVAVAAALDERIACAVVFNFGGPQPETKFPLPEDAEEKFNYAGSGSWESTRNISFSARDVFLPWVIVGSIAPRKLIYAHEFAWDQERDPVWKRLKKIYAWHGKPEHLASTHGYGSVRESGDKASHCNNIGPVHRKAIHASLVKWFGISEPKEYSKRLPSSELLAGLPRIAEGPPAMIVSMLDKVPRTREEKFDDEFVAAELAVRRTRLTARLQGDVSPFALQKVEAAPAQPLGADAMVHRIVLHADGLPLPCLLIVPKAAGDAKPPVVLMVCQQGKAALLKERAIAIAALLKAGAAVCLPDVRGTGELRLDSSRGRTSWDTAVSSSALMLGRPMAGQRLRDLRTVIAWLVTRDDVDARRLALWGDSFAPVNAPDRRLDVPMDAGDYPDQCEPLGGMLASLAALFDENVKVVYTHRAVTDWVSALLKQQLYVPHDAVVPGVFVPIQNGVSEDIGNTVMLALTGRSVRIAVELNAQNQLIVDAATATARTAEYAKVAKGFKKAGELRLDAAQPEDGEIAAWVVKGLR